jgi:hypothetical protein
LLKKLFAVINTRVNLEVTTETHAKLM